MFDDLKQPEGEEIKTSGDVLGGGGLFESAIVKFRIAAAYAGKSSGGARNVTLELREKGTDRNYRETVYVTSGTAKGGKPYYERNGEKHFLPGYEVMDAICMMTTNKGIADQTIEQKTLKIWDSEAKAEIPQEVPVLVDLTGKEINLGILKLRRNNSKKDGNGEYQDTNEERFENVIDRVFHEPSMKTMTEARNKADAEFHQKWTQKWEGKVKDQFKEVTGGAKDGRPSKPSASGDKPSSLFG